MPVFETYASRWAAAEKAGEPDVYTYDKLSLFLREQISQIFEECVTPEGIWIPIARVMAREIPSYGTVYPNSRDADGYSNRSNCLKYLKSSDDVTGVLSLIEICARAMAHSSTLSDQETSNPHPPPYTGNPAEGIVELNERLLRSGIGYQFENRRIIRVDSQYVHAEVVKEALRLVGTPAFQEANDEFMTAHRHLREGKLRDCNTAALRAMENVLKVICDARAWAYQTGDTVERLLRVVRREGLFPDYLGGYFDNLIGAMKAGIPRIRDRQGGHGAAPGDNSVPDHISDFALHLTAANIVLLAKAHIALPLKASPASPDR